MSRCKHNIQVRDGSNVTCLSCGTPLVAETGRSLPRIKVQPFIIGGEERDGWLRAASPISTDELLRAQGYTPLPAQRSDRINPDYVTSYRRSGGKRNAYCPSSN